MKLKQPLLLMLFGLFALTVTAQNDKGEKPFYTGTIGSVEYVTSIASRPQDILPYIDSSGEAKDKRSIEYENSLVPGKDPQTEDDYFVRHRKEEFQSRTAMPPSLVFDAYSSSSQPTDPSLAVGPNHVLVVYNTGFTIYDKAGTQLVPQTPPNPAIFPNGGCCDLTVSYDNAADRWVLTFLGNGAQIAVSDGPNPITAGWYVYNIPQINDYQKLSVWSDGYYITDNSGSSNKVWALERSAMLAGDPGAHILGFNLPGIATFGFYSPQALNVTDSNLPAAGGATIVYLQDNAWPGVSTDHIKFWTIDVDWNNTNNSTISQPTQINTTPFISVFDGGSFSNLDQPGTGPDIDALQATIMNQAQFRKFGSYNSAVFNFVVDTDAGGGELAGIRWFEFRQSGDNQPWTLYQEGTYTAPDGRHAWHGSLAMDAAGNIGMGYSSMSGPSTPGTVRVSSYFTGRLSSDPLGTMTIAEELIAAGNQNIPSFRYGDYSKIDVDPSDNSTFWFINEYMNSGRKGVVGAFQIQGGGADTQPPTTPTNLMATNITSNSATLNWTASTDNVGVVQYNVFIDGNPVGTTANTTFPVTGLSPNTMYLAEVNAQDAAGNTSGNASTNFTTLSPPSGYCSSASMSAANEFISRMRLEMLNNNSGPSTYSDFTNMSTDLEEGLSYSIQIRPDWLGSVQPEGYAMWIDYNNDQDFDDPGEQVFTAGPTTNPGITANFTVPFGTAATSTRMRLSMKRNGIPGPCETFSDGEVEDYTIVLIGGANDTTPPTDPTNLTASNTTDTSTDLSWNASSDNVGVTGYEVFQDGLSIGTTPGTTFNVIGLSPGTTYAFYVEAFDGSGNQSGASNTVMVTTTNGGGGLTQIAAYYFESGLDGWIDGGSDCQWANSSTFAYEGTGSVVLRNGTSSSNAASPTLDLSGNTQVTLEFHFFSRSMEAGDDVFVEFYNGSSYEVIGQYVSGTDFVDNAFYSPPHIMLDAGTYNFNANNHFRIRNSANANNDRIFFDQVIIRGDGGPMMVESTQPDASPNTLVLRNFTEEVKENVSIFPNPATEEIVIQMTENVYDEILVFAANGQVVYTVQPGMDKVVIDISQYTKGMYFVRFVSDGLATTLRFVKQ